ncbi:MAG: glycosyltransferase [Akkermansiaceae bacterium]
MKPPAVSIVLPCYNAENDVARAIESIRAQTLTDWELIAIDDGSQDGTLDVLADLAALDHRIRVRSKPHSGVVDTANLAMQLARAPVIARMDADDVSRPDRLSEQLAYLRRNPDCGAVSCLAHFAGNRETAGGYAHHVDWANGCLTQHDIELNRFIDLPVPNPTLMFRSQLLDNHGRYKNGDFPEDYELFLRWISRGVRIGKVNSPLLDWHDPPTRITRNDTRYSPAAFHQCKAPYLLQAIQKIGCEDRQLWICGAGRPARKLARALESLWKPASGFIDLDPAKIGRTIHGRPVVSPDNLPEKNQAVIINFIASRGVGEAVRRDLIAKGREEGVDFWIAA